MLIFVAPYLLYVGYQIYCSSAARDESERKWQEIQRNEAATRKKIAVEFISSQLLDLSCNPLFVSRFHPEATPFVLEEKKEDESPSTHFTYYSWKVTCGDPDGRIVGLSNNDGSHVFFLGIPEKKAIEPDK